MKHNFTQAGTNPAGFVIWLTGLSGAGKTTIANRVSDLLQMQGYDVRCLDGDIVRKTFSAGLGFSQVDRMENIRRISDAASSLSQNGSIVIVSVISPQAEMREWAKKRIGDERFIEVFVKAQIKTCIQRDPKGLYKKALAGEIENFTGISAVYEEPLCADIVLNTETQTLPECAEKLLEFLNRANFLTHAIYPDKNNKVF